MNKALIFDFDGVIIDSEPIHEKAWKQFLATFPITFTEDLRKSFKGRSAFDNLQNLFGDKYDEPTLRRYVKEKQAIYKKILIKEIRLVPGIQKFIHNARALGYKTCIATSSQHPVLDLVFSQIDLRPLFDIITTSEEVVRSKPNPDIFLKTAEKLKVAPKDCIVFEDAPSGIVAAHNAGMKVVFVATSFNIADVPHPDYTISNFVTITFDAIEKLLQ